MQDLKLDTISGGAAAELFEDAMDAVTANVQDVNYPAKAKRKITLTFVIEPNEHRNIADVSIACKLELAQREPVGTSLMYDKDARGEIKPLEMWAGQQPDQHTIPGVNELAHVRQAKSKEA